MAGDRGLGDYFAVQMATLTRLVVHLDERGVADGQAFLAELVQVGQGLPPGQRTAQEMLCTTLQRQLESSRSRRRQPTSGSH